MRWLAPDGMARFWGSRRVIDPRVSAREIAQHVGLSETSVRMRLHRLEQRGLLTGREVWPNPSLFGVREVRAEVVVRGTRDTARLLEELALVDGVVYARDLLDPQARLLSIYYVSDNPTDTARRTALIRRLAPSGSLTGPVPVPTPPGPRTLAPLDWALLAEMCRHPEHGVGRLAAGLGASLKTVARRYHGLLDSKACWYTPGPETLDGPWSYVRVTCDSAAARPEVEQEFGRLFPSWIPLSPDSMARHPSSGAEQFSGLLLMESLGELERDLRRVEAMRGVASVYQAFSLGTRTYPHWFYQRIVEEAQLANGEPTTGRRSSTARKRRPPLRHSRAGS